MVVHRYWTGGDPPNSPSVFTHHEFVVDHTDRALPVFVVAWLDEHADAVREDQRAVHRSNMVRWWLLARYGGVWVDYDVTVFECLDAEDWPFVAAHRSPCTCAMRFPLGHPVPEAMVQHCSGLGPGELSSPEASGELALRGYLTPDVVLRELPRSVTGQLTGAEWWVDHQGTSRLGRL